jgi:hypothetical protein
MLSSKAGTTVRCLLPYAWQTQWACSTPILSSRAARMLHQLWSPLHGPGYTCPWPLPLPPAGPGSASDEGARPLPPVAPERGAPSQPHLAGLPQGQGAFCRPRACMHACMPPMLWHWQPCDPRCFPCDWLKVHTLEAIHACRRLVLPACPPARLTGAIQCAGVLSRHPAAPGQRLCPARLAGETQHRSGRVSQCGGSPHAPPACCQ